MIYTVIPKVPFIQFSDGISVSYGFVKETLRRWKDAPQGDGGGWIPAIAKNATCIVIPIVQILTHSY